MATHRDPRATLYWHLDATYLGETRAIHQMPLAPTPGLYTLTLVDHRGVQMQRRFTVLSKE